MTVLVVGQAPSRSSQYPDGKTSRRLAELAGVGSGAEPYEFLNLLGAFPGKNGKGDRFPLAEARAAARVVALVSPAERFVLLGRGVAGAFGASGDFLHIVRVWGRPALLMPHPSGVNRWWNEEGREERARRALRRFLRR